MSLLNSINTKLEALKLIYDPSKLLSLLFSKYGDIEEDYYLLYIDQLIYNKSSHYNIVFKEFKHFNSNIEFFKRYYNNEESIKRLPKLCEYYKNYHSFFCKPILKNFHLGELLHNYEDKKAEIFYKNNYCSNYNESDDNNKKSSFSSIDNLTNNQIIFDKKTVGFIENNNNIDNATITLDNSKLLNTNLLSKRSKDDSFRKILNEIGSYKFNKSTNVNSKKNKKVEEKSIKHFYANDNFQKEKIKSSYFSIINRQLNNKNKQNVQNQNININKKDEKENYCFNFEELKNNNKMLKNSNLLTFKKLSSNLGTKNLINQNKLLIKSQIKNKEIFNNHNSSLGIQTPYSLLIGGVRNNIKNIKNNIKSNENIHNHILSIKKKKNNSFDSNIINKSNKYNLNSNFNINSPYLLQKRNIQGSNFSLIKSPLSNILKKKNSQSSLPIHKKFSSLIHQKSLLTQKTFNCSSSNSLPKYKKLNKYKSINYDNNNTIFSSQSSSSDNPNLNNILQKCINKNEKFKISRNKLSNIISQTKSNRKNISNRLNSNYTKSVEEFKKFNKAKSLIYDNFENKKIVVIKKRKLNNKNWNNIIKENSSNKNKKSNVNLNKNSFESAEKEK